MDSSWAAPELASGELRAPDSVIDQSALPLRCQVSPVSIVREAGKADREYGFSLMWGPAQNGLGHEDERHHAKIESVSAGCRVAAFGYAHQEELGLEASSSVVALE